jgi:hypothetical protein
VKLELNIMPIDRELVSTFLADVERNLLPSMCAGSAKLHGCQKLVDSFRRQCEAWRREDVDHIRDITSFVNEMVFAKLILDDSEVSEAYYESELDGTDKTIDFLVALVGSEAHIYCDLKTIQPTINDDWEKYEKFKSESRLTPGTELTMDKDLLGGEIAHELFSARQKFLDYTLELETKIRALPKQNQNYFRLVFCGDGIQWRRDHLEDFADFYFSGQHRPDDPLGLMQRYYMTKKGIKFDSSIHGFCYFERKIRRLQPSSLRCDVRGPALPWSNPQKKN